MFKSWKKQIAVLCVSLAAMGSAAATTMLSFTGTIEGGQHAGAKVSGYVTYELTGLIYWSPDAQTNIGYQAYYPPYKLPLHTSGHATYGTQTVDFGGSGQFDQAAVHVSKNAGPDHADEFMVNIGSYDGAAWTGIQLSVYDFTDGVHASGIFKNTDYSNVDLSLGQAVNWFAAGSQTFGVISNGENSENFRLDTVTMNEVPEPGALALFVLALLGVLGARRRRASGAGRA